MSAWLCENETSEETNITGYSIQTLWESIY